MPITFAIGPTITPGFLMASKAVVETFVAPRIVGIFYLVSFSGTGS